MRIPFLSTVILCLALAVGAQDPPCRWITVRDGLPSNHVYWCMQDREGLMWFGTDAGAARYDGHRFEVFNSSNGAADNEVLKVIEDSEGRVWFLSLNGELSYWWEGRMHNGRTDPILSGVRLHQGICSFVEHTDGTLWFGAYANEIVRLSRDLGHIDHYVDPAHLSDASARVELLPADGPSPMILVGDRQLVHTEAGFILHGRLTVRGTDFFNCGLLPSVGWVLVTAQGLVGLSYTDQLLPLAAGVPQEVPHWLSTDSTGGLWWSLPRGGLVRTFWNGHALEGERRLFRNEMVMRLYEDRDGNHWITTHTHGVGLIAPQQRNVRWYPSSSGGGPEGIRAMHITDHGQLLCGTDGGRLLTLSGGRLTPMPGSESLNDLGRFLCITGKDHRTWLAQDGGVHTFPTGPSPLRLEPVLLRSYMDGPTIVPRLLGMKSIAIGPAGAVVGTFSSICSLVHDETGWHGTMPGNASVGSSRIYAPFFDARGDLWYEQNDRLHRVHAGTDMDFPGLDSVFRIRITDITGIDTNTIVVSSAGSGVTLLRGGKVIARLTKSNGLVSDQCRQLVVRHGRLLVATAEGLSIVPLPVGSAPMQNWSMDSGLPTNDILSVEGDSANAYLGTADGLVVLPYSSEASAGSPPLLSFAALSFADTSFRPGTFADVPLGTDRVSVQAFTPWFGDPAQVEYAFRTALEAPWQACLNGTVTLASWGPGDLVVQMRARRSGSAWSAPISLSLHTEPAWYQRAWVRVLAGVGCVLVGLLIIHLLARRKYRKALARLEKERTLTDERMRIAEDMHDDLGADLSHLLMMTRLAKEDERASRASLEHIEQLSDHMVQKIDDIVWSLDPRSDTVNATLDHLHQRAGTQCERTGIAFHGSIGTDRQGRQLGARQRRDLQLAMKELITNAIKHGRPSGVQLRSDVEQRELCIELRHDLRVDPQEHAREPRYGRGAENMQRRLARHGGWLEGPVRSDQGLAWTIRLPLKSG